MKKYFAIMMIVLLCIVVISGCTSNNSVTTNTNSGSNIKPSNTNDVQEDNTKKLDSGSDSIPQPPALPEE